MNRRLPVVFCYRAAQFAQPQLGFPLLPKRNHNQASPSSASSSSFIAVSFPTFDESKNETDSSNEATTTVVDDESDEAKECQRSVDQLAATYFTGHDFRDDCVQLIRYAGVDSSNAAEGMAQHLSTSDPAIWVRPATSFLTHKLESEESAKLVVEACLALKREYQAHHRDRVRR